MALADTWEFLESPAGLEYAREAVRNNDAEDPVLRTARFNPKDHNLQFLIASDDLLRATLIEGILGSAETTVEFGSRTQAVLNGRSDPVAQNFLLSLVDGEDLGSTSIGVDVMSIAPLIGNGIAAGQEYALDLDKKVFGVMADMGMISASTYGRAISDTEFTQLGTGVGVLAGGVPGKLGKAVQGALVFGAAGNAEAGKGTGIISNVVRRGESIAKRVTGDLRQQIGDVGLRGRVSEVANSNRLWTIDNAVDLVSDIRKTLTISADKNIAFASFNINGNASEMIAVSGKHQFPGTVAETVNRQFTYVRTGNNDRLMDSEAKIFENLAAQLPRDARGSVRLFSERPTCVSCSQIVPQFEKMYPGVKVNVTYGPRK